MSTSTVQSVVAISTTLTMATLFGYLGYLWYRKDRIPKTWRPVAKVTKIHLYPLKSGRRNELQEAECTRFGIRSSASPKNEQDQEDNKSLKQIYDRSFLVYGSESKEMKTARTYPKMVLIEVNGTDKEDHVCFDAPGMRSLVVKIPKVHEAAEFTISLHKEEKIFSLDCGEEAAFWMSKYILGKESGARLGFHDAQEEHQRDISKVHKNFFQTYRNLNNKSTGLYSDLTAVLLVNETSVEDLNAKIETENELNPTLIKTENFRPNICIKGDGAPPFAEDYWDWIKIGDNADGNNVIMRNVKPCTRCMLTTINQETGTKNQDREPLNTLEKYRKLKNVLDIKEDGELTVMGANLSVVQDGRIRLNDTVYVNI